MPAVPDRWRGWSWTIPLFLLVAVLIMAPVLPRAASAVFGFPGHSDILQYVFFIDHFAEAFRGAEPFFHLERMCYPDGVHLGQISISPVFTATGGAIVAVTGLGAVLVHNLLSVVFLALTGFIGARYAARFTGDIRVATAAGVLLMTMPPAIQGVAHVVNVGLFLWIPLAFLAVERVLDDPRPRNAALLAAAVLLQVGSSLEYAAYLGVMGPLYLAAAIAVDRARIDVERIRMFVIAGMLTLGVGLLYYSRFEIAGFDAGGVRAIAAHSWLLKFPRTYIPLILVLAVTGYLLVRLRRTDLLPLYITGLVGLPLAFGTQIPYEPYVLLHMAVPLLGYFRTPMRMLVFPFITIAIAFPVLAAATARVRPIRWADIAIVALALGLFLFTFPVHQVNRMAIWDQPVHDPADPPVYEEIAASPGDSVVWYPLAQYPENMYASIQYDKGTVECGSTTPIRSQVRFDAACGELFFTPTAECKRYVDDYNTTYLVHHRARFMDWMRAQYTYNYTLPGYLVQKTAAHKVALLNFTEEDIRTCGDDHEWCYRTLQERYAALPMTTVVSQDENMSVYRLDPSR